MKRFFLSLALPLATFAAWAQGPNNTGTYYKSADGKTGKLLKTALYGIISSHVDVGYGSLWDVYKKSDVRPDGTYWDMYSNITSFTDADRGNYSKEGDAVNREHSVPQSWFSKASPMRSDAFHVVPTDGYVNNRRGNYPFGEVATVTYASAGNFSKLGTCATAGYEGTVFEPNDEYKGDFARSYFYMATAYEDRISSWGGVFGNGTYPGIDKWQLDMLLRWAKDDPVSQKEIDRNNAIYGFQKNRNPFIDYPGLEQFVWGDSVNVAFSYDHYATGYHPSDPSTDPDPSVTPTDPVTPGSGEQVFTRVFSASDLTVGSAYLIVCESANKAMAGVMNNVRDQVDVTISGGQIVTAVDAEGKPSLVTLGGSAGAYELIVDGGKWLAHNSGKNYLQTVDELSEGAQWTITITSSGAEIRNNRETTRTIRYNSSSPRFATYTQGQQEVQLYKLQVADAIGHIGAFASAQQLVKVYSLDGQRLRVAATVGEAISGLPAGIYIVGGKKLVVR